MKAKKLSGFIIGSSLFISSLAFAAPQGGVVAAGTADISKSGNTTNINQTSSSAVINWHSFDTAGNESVNFNQPNQNSVVLNRINSGVPTNFAGNLTANGQVFIVNPAGMVFAEGSKINTAAFLATTMDIQDNNFMSGKYQFFSQPGSGNSSIINNGYINGSARSSECLLGVGPWIYDAGFVALIAPNVINGQSGYISAGAGRVVLASGKSFVLDFNQDGLINFDASSIIKNGYIKNTGEIFTYSGEVFMTTNTASKVLDSMINTSGITEANAVIKNNNEVILGTITTNEITASYVTLKADNGITLNGPIHYYFTTDYGFGHGPAETITAKTTHGNIAINNYIRGEKIFLSAENGAITESSAGDISASNLNTLSATGTTLGGKNYIWNFTAENTTHGGIYLKNLGEPVTKLGKTSGGYTLDKIGFWEYYFGDNG